MTRWTCALLALLLLPAAAATAGGKWSPLFNGKDLSGWKAHGAERWVVEHSGIFFHSSLTGTAIAGVQAEVDPRPGMHTGGLYESAGREWLVKPGPEAEKALRIGG